MSDQWADRIAQGTVQGAGERLRQAMARADRATLDNWARILHNAYELAARDCGWRTQEASRKRWAEVPEPNRQATRAALLAVLQHITGTTGRPPGAPERVLRFLDHPRVRGREDMDVLAIANPDPGAPHVQVDLTLGDVRTLAAQVRDTSEAAS